MMSTLTVTRWTRYGKDRVYVKTADGADVGHVDLLRRTTHLADANYESQFFEIARHWIGEGITPEAVLPQRTTPPSSTLALASSELAFPPPNPLDPVVEQR